MTLGIIRGPLYCDVHGVYSKTIMGRVVTPLIYESGYFPLLMEVTEPVEGGTNGATLLFIFTIPRFNHEWMRDVSVSVLFSLVFVELKGL